MSRRRDKGRTLARYIGAHCDMPTLSWRGDDNTVSTPWPYYTKLVTDKSNARLIEAVNKAPDDMLSFAIRYDSCIDGVDNALVLMKLSTFTKLLNEHYKTINREN